VAQELFHFGGAHGGWVAQFVEADETFVPLDVGLLGTDGIAAQANGFAQAVSQFFLLHGGFLVCPCAWPQDRLHLVDF
jgi:hypothetical protein